MKIITALMFICLLLAGCIENVISDGYTGEETLVLNSILDINSDTIKATFTWSDKLAGNNFKPVENAVLRLFEDNKFAGEFKPDRFQIYFLSFNPKPDRKYRLEAETDNKRLWAETKVPANKTAVISRYTKTNYSGVYQISLPYESTTGYNWVTATGFKGISVDRKKNIADLIFTNSEQVDDFNRIINELTYFYYEHKFYLRITPIEQKDSLHLLFEPEGVNPPFEIFLLSVDEHLDKYMKSSISLEKMDIFTQEMPMVYSPYPMYSNIHGGTGIFGSVNKTSKVFTK